MPIINRHQFFQMTLAGLGLKEVTEGGQSYVVSDVNLPEFPLRELYENHERKLSTSRKAAFAVFSKKLVDKQPPVFTKADISQPLQQACEMNYAMTVLESLELTCLAQAIVDDDIATVKAMLNQKPELLLFQPEVIVTSEYTGQRFSVDGNFLGLACRRKQIEMVKIITRYFDKLQADDEQNDEIAAIKNAGLSQWLELKTDAKGDIQVPADYQVIIDDLITVFTSEPIAHGTTDFRTLSFDIETAMEVLYDCLLLDFKEDDISKRRVFSKQNHLDIELLLYAAYKAYDTHFNSFKTAEQRDAYSIRVIGILQNFLQPETAKIFCEGLYYVVEENKAISHKASGLKLKDGNSFYSGSDFALRLGLGFERLVASWGRGVLSLEARLSRGFAHLASGNRRGDLGNLCHKKVQQFSENNTPLQTVANTSTGPRT